MAIRRDACGTVNFALAMHIRTVQLLVGLLMSTTAPAQNGAVTPTGAMRNAMFNGQLAGVIMLDSIARPGSYGIGPQEHLRGEILLLDGHVFVSEVARSGDMKVEERPTVRAPFFVHQQVEKWTSIDLPDSVVDLPTLDAYLTARFASNGTPFAFRIQGEVTSVDAHIVDVPMGSEVSGPDDAHRHNKDYRAEGRTMDILGFFSTEHKGVFTHHDTNIHMHAITKERDWMGHVEEMRFVPTMVLLQVAASSR